MSSLVDFAYKCHLCLPYHFDSIFASKVETSDLRTGSRFLAKCSFLEDFCKNLHWGHEKSISN